jgi:hypothetical protein
MSTRLRRPSVARELAALGRDALLPMLELLALRDYPRALDAEEQATLEVALLEAVAALRDRRAAPVLRLALETRDHPDALRAAARGLGALAGNDDVSFLIATSQRTGPRALAALEGLGAARRDDATQALIAVLERSTDVAVVNAAAHGLSEAGTSWGTSAATTLPSRCSAALLRALLRVPEAARGELQVAIVAVAAPDALAQLAAARTQTHDPALRARLVSLERMVRRQLAAR